VVQPLYFVRPIDRSADHLDGGSYLLFWAQSMPCRHCFSERRAISQDAGAIVQRRRLCGIGVDFVIVGQFAGSPAPDWNLILRRNYTEVRASPARFGARPKE
jgi:hypothetical protein